MILLVKSLLQPRILRFIIAASLLLFYTSLAFVSDKTKLEGDEIRYVYDAQNLMRGEFGQIGKRQFIAGPGYGILLIPFAKPEAWILGRCMNALYIALAMWFLFGLVQRWANTAWAAVASVAIGTHPSIVKWVPSLLSEPLSLLCVTSLMMCLERVFQTPTRNWKWIALAGLFFGWLILTRVLFGYVAMILLGGAAVFAVVHVSWRRAWVHMALICCIALSLCLPYLMYTHTQTGRFPCWSTIGGEMLYWMTSTREGECGSWMDEREIPKRTELAGHLEVYSKVFTKPGSEMDTALTALAMKQFSENPKGVFYNWLCNHMRLWFGFPRSFQVEDLTRGIYFFWNGPLLLMLLTCLLVGWRQLLRLGVLPTVLLTLAAIYYGGSSLAAGQPRYIVVILPILWFWVAVAGTRWFKFEVKNDNNLSVDEE
jgi:hypothetical protein